MSFEFRCFLVSCIDQDLVLDATKPQPGDPKDRTLGARDVGAVRLVARFIHYENNLLPKVLFWPVTLGALWVLTSRTFY